jgi:hypothetical protein
MARRKQVRKKLRSSRGAKARWRLRLSAAKTTRARKGKGTDRSRKKPRRAGPRSRAGAAKRRTRRAKPAALPRVKWISSRAEHEDYPGQTLRTDDHEVIQTWAEERGAIPASVPGIRFQGRRGLLRLDFPNRGDRGLEHIDWDVWFDAFDARKLEFVFQEHARDGSRSNFFQLDVPERAWR